MFGWCEYIGAAASQRGRKSLERSTDFRARQPVSTYTTTGRATASPQVGEGFPKEGWGSRATRWGGGWWRWSGKRKREHKKSVCCFSGIFRKIQRMLKKKHRKKHKLNSTRIIYFYYLFFRRCPTHKLCFLSCRPFIVNVTFSTGLVVSSVSWLGQLTVGV